MEARVIEVVELDKIKPHPMNAKTHDLELIKSSLQEFNQTEPLVVSRESGYIVAGNGRHRAMRLLGWTHANIIYLDDLTPLDELRALAIFNQSGHAPNDKGRLYELLAAIQEDPQGLIGTGFVDRDVERLAAIRQSGAERTAALFSAAGMDVDPAKPATLKVPMTQKQAELVHEIIKRYAETNDMTPGAALFEIVNEAGTHF